jgi:hypothetical protein
MAARFGYSEAWLSKILSSPAVKAHLARRRAELVDPLIRAALQERLQLVAR